MENNRKDPRRQLIGTVSKAMFGMWPVWVSVSKATAFGMDAISAHRQSTQSTKTALQQPLQAAGYWRDIDG